MEQPSSLRSLLAVLVALSIPCAGCGDDDAVRDGGPDGGAPIVLDAMTAAGSGGSGGAAGSGGSGGSSSMDPDAAFSDAGALHVGVPCEEADVAAADLTLSTDSNGAKVWSGLIHVTGVLEFGAVDVTIEPGTTFIMDADASLELGWNSNDATVMAVGTEALPIRFCGKEATPGYWGGVSLGRQVTSDSVLEQVQISNGGGTGFGLRLESAARLTHVLVEDSSSDGVRAARFSRDSESLSVTGAGGAAVVLFDAPALNDFPLGGEFSNNDDNSVRLRFGDIDVDVTIHDPGIPYVQEGEILIKGVSVVFEAGVDYRFAADAFLDVGWNSNAAELQVEGEDMNPVVFQGEEPTLGYWTGIRINGAVRSTSRIAYAEIHHGGGLDTPVLQVLARITLDHLTVEDNQRGVRITGPLQPDSTDLTVTGTENGPPVRAHPTALPTLPEGGSYVGNDDDEIVVDGAGTVIITGTIPDLGVPYHVLGDVELQQGSDVEIAAGTEFIMASGAMLEVGWNSGVATLSAVGTASEPIVFVGEQDTAGYWTGVVVRVNAGGDCELDHVTIANAGEAGDVAVRLYRAVPITNTTIQDSAGGCLSKPAADSTDYTTSNTFTNCAQGNVLDN